MQVVLTADELVKTWSAMGSPLKTGWPRLLCRWLVLAASAALFQVILIFDRWLDSSWSMLLRPSLLKFPLATLLLS